MGVAFLAVGAEGTQTAIANGDTRTLSFYHTHSKERITVTYKKNGRYDASALKQLNHFLRDWRNQKATTMEPRLFDVVWEVQNDAGGRAPIHIVSAFRSPETNEKLRSRSKGVAKHSQHTLGRAMDLHFTDVSVAKVREAGLRLQRGGVGFYPTSGLPFVHLDVGSVRHWPRMSRDQLVRLFPDGRTVHLPTDGKPLKNYALAMADLKRDGAVVRKTPNGATAIAMADTGSRGGSSSGKGFISRFLGGEDDDASENAAPASAPAATAPATAAPARPETPPAPEPAAPVAVAAAEVPLPVARPGQSAGPQLAAAYAPQDIPNTAPGMIWRTGPSGVAPAASADYQLPPTTPSEASANVALPMPRPAETTPALTASAPLPVIRPEAGQIVTASLGSGANLADERNMALRLLNSFGMKEPSAELLPDPEQSSRARSHIAAAHEAFAAEPAANKPAPAQIAAVVQQGASARAEKAPQIAYKQERSSRTQTALLHPNFQRTKALIARPANVLPNAFGGNPTYGMSSSNFSGYSVIGLRTVSFGPQRTAELNVKPRS